MRCWSWRSSGALVAALLAGSARAAAQNPSDIAALTALRDSLKTITTTDAIRQVPRTWAGGASGAMTSLRQGFISLRLGEIGTTRGDLDAALAAFDDAVHADRSLPYAWFGRALAKLMLGDRDYAVKAAGGQALGERYYPAFLRDAAQTLALDSTFRPMLDFLVVALAAQGDRDQPIAFIEALERGAHQGYADPRIHLVLGRAYRGAGDDEHALIEFAAFGASGGDSGVALLERARSLAGLGRLEEAVAAYRQGAEAARADGRGSFHDDLGWVADSAELAGFDSLNQGAATRRWLDHFWSLREAEALRAADERLREHLRRWAYVYRHFRVVHPELRLNAEKVRVLAMGPCTDSRQSLDDFGYFHSENPGDYRRRERLLDHRAIIYMRHGEPWRRIAPGPASDSAISEQTVDDRAGTITNPASEPAISEQNVDGRTGTIVDTRATSIPPAALPRGERAHGTPLDTYRAQDLGARDGRERTLGRDIWLYWFDGAPRFIYLSGSGSLGPGPTSVLTVLPLAPDLLFELGRVDPIFARAAKRVLSDGYMPSRAVPLECQISVADMSAHTRQDVATSISSDSHTLLFHRSLDPILQTFAVGRPADGSARILIAYAVRGDHLVPRARTDGRPGVSYSLALRASAVDTAQGTIRQSDTTRTVVARDTIPATAFLSGIFQLAVPDGRFTVRAAIFDTTRDAGTSLARADVRLTDASPGLSDLIPAVERGGVRWENGGDVVLVNVLGAYARGAIAPVYYEVYGLEAGDNYRTTVSLAKLGHWKARGVNLVFTEAATGPVMHIRRTVDLQNLARGQYELTVTVAEVASGRSSTRKQLINVVER